MIIFLLISIATAASGEYTSNENFGRIFSNSKVCNKPLAFGFVKRNGTAEYYMISDILMNWIDAENFCQKSGANLPSISNQSDQDYLRGFFEFLNLKTN